MITAYLQTLKDHNLKLTLQRKAVLECFLLGPRRLGVYEVHSLLKKTSGLPTVYRILDEFENAGVLVRVQDDSRKLFYSLCTCPDEHHHHMVCVGCGKVDEVEGCGFEHRKKINGFKVLRHFIQIDGLCPKCLKEQ